MIYILCHVAWPWLKYLDSEWNIFKHGRWDFALSAIHPIIKNCLRPCFKRQLIIKTEKIWNIFQQVYRTAQVYYNN